MTDIYNKLFNAFEDFEHDIDVDIFDSKLAIKSNLTVKRDNQKCSMSDITCFDNLNSIDLNKKIKTVKLNHINNMLDSLLSDVDKNTDKKDISTNKEEDDDNDNNDDNDDDKNIKMMTEEEYIKEDPEVTDEDLETWNNKTLLLFQDEINKLKQLKQDFNIQDDIIVKYAKQYDDSIKTKKDIKPKNIEGVINYIKSNYDVERAG